MLIIKTAEYFCGGLTEAEKRQLFDEHVQWYRMYGMSMRPVPKTWEEFQEYWDRKCSEDSRSTRPRWTSSRSASPNRGSC